MVSIALLTMANEDGVVDACLGAVARDANVTEEEVREALVRLQQPDPLARFPGLAGDGRAIEVVPRGWRILNPPRGVRPSSRRSGRR